MGKHAATWSETANQLKRRLDLVRWIIFCLPIAGALVAAIASQIGPEAGAAARELPKSHTVFATLGAVLLGAVTFLSGRFLRDAQVQAWVRARAASGRPWLRSRRGYAFIKVPILGVDSASVSITGHLTGVRKVRAFLYVGQFDAQESP